MARPLFLLLGALALGSTQLLDVKPALGAAGCPAKCMDDMRQFMQTSLETDQLKYQLQLTQATDADAEFLGASLDPKPCLAACSWENLGDEMNKCLGAQVKPKTSSNQATGIAVACEKKFSEACFASTPACDIAAATREQQAQSHEVADKRRCDELKPYCDQTWALYDEQKCTEFHNTCHVTEQELADEEAARRKVQEEQENRQALVNTVNAAANIAMGRPPAAVSPATGAGSGSGIPPGSYSSWTEADKQQAAAALKVMCACPSYQQQCKKGPVGGGSMRACYEAGWCVNACFVDHMPADWPERENTRKAALENQQNARRLGSNAPIVINR